MINLHKEIVKELKSILPVHYEMALHSGIKTPCISYMQLDNPTVVLGDSLEYSTIQYQIKVWSTKISDLQEYALAIDDKMRFLGFKRMGARELYDKNSTMMQKILTYEIFLKEDLKEV